MPDTLRTTVKAPDSETAEAVKDRFFKKLFEHAGDQVTFEVPLDAEDEAKAIEAFASEKGCEASTETHEDPLDEAEPVDFW